jgi:hypothetical protein
MKKVLIVLSLFVVAGCATAKNAPPLVETNHDTVRNCREVAKFRSEAGKKYWGPPPVLGNFKYESAVKAKAMGATHAGGAWHGQCPHGMGGRLHRG